VTGQSTRPAESAGLSSHRAMLAGLRHDLRTPLNAVIGYSEMLLEEVQEQDACAPGLASLHSAGQELLRLVNGLLDPVLVESGTLDVTPDVLQSVLRSTLLPPIHAIIETCEALLREVRTRGDAGERPANESLPVDLQKIHGAAGRFRALVAGVTGLPAGETGPGFSGEGAEDPGAAGSRGPLPQEAGVAGIVLVVDDNEANRDLLARYLGRLGHTVVLAENGRQALERAAQETFDLVLLDIMMPEVNGYEVLQRLKGDAASRDIPVIMISALDEIESVARCIEAGAEDYLPKPFNPTLLRARVNACLEKKRLRDLEVEYLRNVALVTDAAMAVEAGIFDPNDLAGVAGRGDTLGHLARVFQEMVREMQAREQRAKEEEALKRELRLATEIQLSMLPAKLPRPADLDIGARMIPARAVGGDFFDVFTAGPGQLGLAVGDVSGKGMPAALFMALTCALLRAEAMRTTSPERALRSVNRHLCERNSGGVFVTLLYGVLDRATHQFSYVRAGHEYPLLYDRTGAPLAVPEGRSVPLGIFQDLVIETQTLTLLPGDTMLLYTDGVTEAMDEGRELFGLERLEKQLAGHPDEPAQVMCDRIVEAVTSYQGRAPQSDDITLLAVRALGEGTARTGVAG
jgi:serine phosphatase RsbU (regulator of sigma subunit)/FixJ family two-component response regulator